MTKTKAVKLVEYEANYAADTVAMWRTSKEKAIGTGEIHSFDDHLNFLNEVLAKENTIYLAIFDGSDTVADIAAFSYVHCSEEGGFNLSQ